MNCTFIDPSKLDNYLDELKEIFRFPRLYMSNYFADLGNKIDVEAQRLIIEKSELNLEKEATKIAENWELMIEIVKKYETECFNCFPVNKYDEMTTNTTESSIEKIRVDIDNLKKNIEPTNNVESNQDEKDEMENEANFLMNNDTSQEEIENAYNQIEIAIYDLIFKLQTILFTNKSVLFIEKELFDGLITSKVLY